MGNITIRQKNEVKTCAFDGFDFLSIFDEQFSIDDFDKSIQIGRDASTSVLSKARKAVRNAYSELNDEEVYHYEVSMTDELKQAFRDFNSAAVGRYLPLRYIEYKVEKNNIFFNNIVY